MQHLARLVKPSSAAVPAVKPLTESDVKVTQQGVVIAGIYFDFSRLLPNWAQVKHLHRQANSTFYLKRVAAIVSAAAVVSEAVGAVAASNFCFKDPHNSGVGTFHLEDETGDLAKVMTMLSSRLFTDKTCGDVSPVDCQPGTASHFAFALRFHLPEWMDGCIEAVMKKIGDFSIDDTFHLDHIQCVEGVAHEVLHHLSASIRERLASEHQGNPGAVVLGVVLTLAFVGVVAGTLACYQKQSGHLPFTQRKFDPTRLSLGAPSRAFPDSRYTDVSDTRASTTTTAAAVPIAATTTTTTTTYPQS